jgi:hypothetical protein
MRLRTAGVVIGGLVALAALGASLAAVESQVPPNPAPHSYAAARAEAKNLCHAAFGSRLLGAGPASVRNVRTPARTKLTYPARPTAFPGVSTTTFAAYCNVAAGPKFHKLYAIAKGFGPVFVMGPTRRYSA